MKQCACGDWLDANDETWHPDWAIQHRQDLHDCGQDVHATRTVERPEWSCAGCGEPWPE